MATRSRLRGTASSTSFDAGFADHADHGGALLAAVGHDLECVSSCGGAFQLRHRLKLLGQFSGFKVLGRNGQSNTGSLNLISNVGQCKIDRLVAASLQFAGKCRDGVDVSRRSRTGEADSHELTLYHGSRPLRRCVGLLSMRAAGRIRVLREESRSVV